MFARPAGTARRPEESASDLVETQRRDELVESAARRAKEAIGGTAAAVGRAEKKRRRPVETVGRKRKTRGGTGREVKEAKGKLGPVRIANKQGMYGWMVALR